METADIKQEIEDEGQNYEVGQIYEERQFYEEAKNQDDERMTQFATYSYPYQYGPAMYMGNMQLPTQDQFGTLEQAYRYSRTDGLQASPTISDAGMSAQVENPKKKKRKRASCEVMGSDGYVPAQDDQGQIMTGESNLIAADEYYPQENTPKKPSLKKRVRGKEYRSTKKPRSPPKYDIPVVHLCYDDPQLCDAVIVSGYHNSEFPNESQAKVMDFFSSTKSLPPIVFSFGTNFKPAECQAIMLRHSVPAEFLVVCFDSSEQQRNAIITKNRRSLGFKGPTLLVQQYRPFGENEAHAQSVLSKANAFAISKQLEEEEKNTEVLREIPVDDSSIAALSGYEKVQNSLHDMAQDLNQNILGIMDDGTILYKTETDELGGNDILVEEEQDQNDENILNYTIDEATITFKTEVDEKGDTNNILVKEEGEDLTEEARNPTEESALGIMSTLNIMNDDTTLSKAAVDEERNEDHTIVDDEPEQPAGEVRNQPAMAFGEGLWRSFNFVARWARFLF